jgi:hypothetical protein
MSIRRIRTIGHVLVVAALAMLGVAVGAAPAEAAPAAGPGHDISHPDCGDEFPDGSAFGIVGINSGRPFSANPCMAAQYRWAAGRPGGAAVYVNTGNPAPRSAHYWPRSGSTDPALCQDSSSRTDPGCAYDYGWHAAADALRTGETLGPAVLGHTWWLDVETSNTWNGNGVANTALLQGMYDYLRGHGVARVGLYSTAMQWQEITGGYTAASAGRYRAAWSPHVVPDHPLHAAPLWIATVGSLARARSLCATSFTGARTQMVQTVKGGVDTNVVCAA